MTDQQAISWQGITIASQEAGRPAGVQARKMSGQQYVRPAGQQCERGAGWQEKGQ
jgi:hypothetical protein